MTNTITTTLTPTARAWEMTRFALILLGVELRRLGYAAEDDAAYHIHQIVDDYLCACLTDHDIDTLDGGSDPYLHLLSEAMMSYSVPDDKGDTLAFDHVWQRWYYLALAGLDYLMHHYYAQNDDELAEYAHDAKIELFEIAETVEADYPLSLSLRGHLYEAEQGRHGCYSTCFMWVDV